MKGFVAVALAIGVAATGPQAHAQQADALTKRLKGALALDPEAVRSKIRVKDDAMEVAAQITSDRAFVERGLTALLESPDVFLRALVHKKSGGVRYQVYASTSYLSDWKHFDQVNIQTLDGEVVTADLVKISSSVVSCYRGSCRLSEHVAFEVGEEALRELASSHDQGPRLWRFRFKSRNGHQWDDGLSTGEVAGFMAAVDDYVANLQKPSASETPSASPAPG